MIRRRALPLIAALAWVGGCDGCKKNPPVLEIAEASTTAATAPDASAPLPPRCEETKALPLDRDLVEYGEALVTKSGVLVGAAYEKDGKRRAGIVTVAREGDAIGAARLDDAGELAADAPPPDVVLLGGKAIAATYPPSKDARELAIDAWRIPQQKDDSFAFDVAVRESGDGLVAWDEDAPAGSSGARGIVKVAPLPFDPKAPPIVASPESSDADSPRVALRPGGYWVVWIAKKPEPEKDAAPELEGPGERPHLAWLEIAALDAKGSPAGAPLRVTKAGSRIESFDLAAQGDSLDVLVKDDEQPADGAGSRLVLVTVRGAESQVRVVLESGAGRGVPDLLGARIAFADLHDHVRLRPLAAGGRVSVEPALDGARPLAALGDQILAGFSGDPARALRILRCPDPPEVRSGKQ